MSIYEDLALKTLLSALSIPGVTGEEKAAGDWAVRRLAAAGVPRKNIFRDNAHKKIPLPTQDGNVIAHVPGTVPCPRRMFSAHLDTVDLAAGVVPIRRGSRIIPRGHTALGGDDRTGVASIITALETVLKKRLPHPPITILFTVREESGLWGAKFVNPRDLLRPAFGVNIDGGSPAEFHIGAVGADRWEVDITGIASHAGVHPEKGVSAIAIASAAIDKVRRSGWFGKVVKGRQRGTSNVGVISGGSATNIVADHAFVKGESRSHDMAFVSKITGAYRSAFERAVSSIKNDKGRRGRIDFRVSRDYFPFRLKDGEPVIALARSAARAAGMRPTFGVVNGGLDANHLTRVGIPVITLGAGQHNPHTVDEYIDIREYLGGCRVLVAMMTGEAPKK
jgi:tripeptide aminopeptidase